MAQSKTISKIDSSEDVGSELATKRDVEEIVSRVVKGAVDDLSEVIRGVVEHFENRFTAVDARFDAVDASIAQLASQLSQMQVSIDDILRRLKSLESESRAVRNDLGELYDRSVVSEQHAKEIKAIEQEVTQLWLWAEKVSKETGIALPKINQG